MGCARIYTDTDIVHSGVENSKKVQRILTALASLVTLSRGRELTYCGGAQGGAQTAIVEASAVQEKWENALVRKG